jgi:hypothetical protein
MPSLTRNRYVQPRPLKKTGRLATQDVSKALTLKGQRSSRRLVKQIRDSSALLVGNEAWWHAPRGLQKGDQLLIYPLAEMLWNTSEREKLISFILVFGNGDNQPDPEFSNKVYRRVGKLGRTFRHHP